METLADRLVYARKKAGLTQKELAERAKIKNQSTIGMLETGERKSSSFIPSLASVLTGDPLWLATGRGNPPEVMGATGTARGQVLSIEGRMRPSIKLLLDIASQLPDTDVGRLIERGEELLKVRQSDGKANAAL